MKAKDIKRVIDMLEAYRGDLDWWRTCGHDYWVDVTNGTGTYALKMRECGRAMKGVQVPIDSPRPSRKSKAFYGQDYIADVGQAIEDLTNPS